MENISLLGLRVLREVAASGSISAAARRLGYTQSAVSRQVAAAEAAAGRRLFERHARGVEPTPAGRVVLRHARRALAELEAGARTLDGLDAQPSGRLRVAGIPTSLAALVPRSIAAHSVRSPRTEVQLREGTTAKIVTLVAAQRVDLAVVTLPDERHDGVDLTRLLTDPLLVAVDRDHALATEASVHPDRLRDERWITGSAEPRSGLLGTWASDGWSPRIAHVVRDWTAKLGLVAAGQGVTMVPALAAAALPSTIATVRIEHPDAERAIAIATPSAARAPGRARAFVESLRDVAAELGLEARRRLRP